MGRKLSVVAICALFSGATGAQRQHASAVGVIEGTVTLEAAPPPRRTTNRYPGALPETHQVQELPAVAYLVGPVAGSSSGGGARPTMAQRDTTFTPSVVVTRVGGSVAFPNGDPFFHNVFSYSSAQRFDLGRYPQGESKEVSFQEPGLVEVFCEVHDFMRGAIVVTENPYHAVIGADGRFRFEGVPDGTYTIAFWQQDHQPLEQRVVVTAGGTARVDVNLKR